MHCAIMQIMLHSILKTTVRLLSVFEGRYAMSSVMQKILIRIMLHSHLHTCYMY